MLEDLLFIILQVFSKTIILLLKRSVDQFQIVKKKDGSVSFNLVVNKNFDITVQKYICNYWENKFNTRVNINIVDAIPLTKSNKRKFIINE